MTIPSSNLPDEILDNEPLYLPDGRRQWRVGHLLGVPLMVTARVWLMPLVWLVVGVLIAWSALPDLPDIERVVWGVLYAGLVLISYVLVHLAGHIISGRRVNAVMDAALLDGVRVVNVYHDAPDAAITSRQHVGRAIGGPIANTALALLALLIWALTGAHAALFMGVVNVILGLGALIPAGGLDGEILLREWRRNRG